MSGERCRSLDRVQRRGEGNNLFTSGVHVPDRSPNRLFTFDDPQRVSYCRCNAGMNEKGSSKFPDVNNIELLENFEDPQFLDLPPDSSFDEIRCTMVTPPRLAQPAASTAIKGLDGLRPETQNSPIQIGNTRKRNAPFTAEATAEPPFCCYKIPPLPKDPQVIPPPPKNPKDVVALIRRAKAIARLKKLEAQQGAVEQPRGVLKKKIRRLAAKHNLARKVPTATKPEAVASRHLNQAPTYSTSKHQTDYDRAEVFSKLSKTKSPLGQFTPPSPKIPTFQNILERIAVIRSRTNNAKPVLVASNILAPKPQQQSEELDEFEVLEELYGAVKPDQRPPTQQSVSDLRKRINMLQQQFFQSPSPMEPILEELDEFEALEQQYGNAISFAPPTSEQFTTDLQDRINTLKETLFQSPTRDSVDALGDAGENGFLEEITMPDFDEDISFNELNIADITAPDLYNLSLPGYNVSLDPDFITEFSMEEEGDANVTERVITEETSQQPGILASVVNVIVDRLKNIFSASKAADAQNVAEARVEPDTSLPIIFEMTPSSESPITQTAAEKLSAQKPGTSTDLLIPPHPKDPKDYKAMIKRAQAIQKRQIAESAAAKKSVSSLQKGALPAKKKREGSHFKKRVEKSRKVYPPGAYSPSYARAVARARSLAGLKNVSAVLNPERAARMAEQKATREAKLAAIEALPPVERMKEKMRSMRRHMGISSISIEALATLEAIRANLLESQKTKYRPGGRPRENPNEFMSSSLEEIELKDDLIHFSPLKPQEARMRLLYLKDQLAKQAINTLQAAEEKQVGSETTHKTPHISPIQLYTPSGPRVEKTERGAQRGEPGTSTRQDLTKTDEQPNLIYDIQEGTSLSREEAATFLDDLADIEAPTFLDMPDTTLPRDPSIPTTNEIINRIRSKIKENLHSAPPDIPQSFFHASPEMIPFPQDLPEEELFEIKTPEFARTPIQVSPHLKSVSPFEKDRRMYAWGEHPSVTLPTQVPTSIVSPAPSEQAKAISPTQKTKFVGETICIPPHPEDPKDYKAMIKRAHAIQRVNKQQEMYAKENSRRPQEGRLVLKKRAPKLLPKKIQQRDYYDMEQLTAVPPIPKKYREAVARARSLHGLKNRSAALNFATVEDAAKSDHALPEVEKIKIRMEQLRKHPSHKRDIEPSADLLGTLAAIRANIPQEEFRNLESQQQSEAFDIDTPKTSKRHGQRFLIREFAKQPRSVAERFQRLKDAQHAIPLDYPIEDWAPSAEPSVVYSPIKLVSPSGTVRRVSGRLSSPYVLAERNINETPKRVTLPIRQFKDLEDMPLDELDYENEPAFPDISFEEPLSPPPRPSDIINRIKSKLKVVTQRPALSSPPILKFPEELPDEELLRVSAPSFTQSPSTTPSTGYNSPKVSLPMAWAEAQPATLVTPENLAGRVYPHKVFEEEDSTPNSLTSLPPHPKDPKDYAAMIKRSKAIHKLKKQRKDEEVSLALQLQKSPGNDRLPIYKWQKLPFRKINANPKKSLVLRKTVKESEKMFGGEKVQPVEAPPLPQDYIEAVAKSRLLHGLKTRTAAFKPQIEAKKAAQQAKEKDREVEKIRARMERLRKNPHRRQRIKPTIEQIAYLEALKLMSEFQRSSPEQFTKSPTSLPLPKTPLTPRFDLKKMSEAESRALDELAEFEALEQLDEAVGFSSTSTKNLDLKQRIGELRKLLDAEDISQHGDISLAEFVAMEARPVQQADRFVKPLNTEHIISELRQRPLVTPRHIGPKERLRLLMAKRKVPRVPIITPVKTPETHYTPITLSMSPDKEESKKHYQQATARVIFDILAELDRADNIADIQEPSDLSITPSTPLERPRPRDIIERVRAQVKERFRPEVPTGQLLELRTPPRMLPLPTELTEDNLLDLSYPSFKITPKSAGHSQIKYTLNSPDISLPQLFHPTPPISPVPEKAEHAEDAILTAVNIPKRLPTKNYAEILSKMKEFRERNVLVPAESSLAAGPKNEMQFRKNEQQTVVQSPKSRYESIQTEKTYIPSNFEKRPGTIPYGGVFCSPIRFISPGFGEVQIDSAETLNLHEFNLPAFANLSELEELSEIEQPSYTDVSNYQINNDQYLPLTPPQTPPPAPAAIIDRIRQQYYQKNAKTSQEKPMSTPLPLEFPEALTEEQISELSAPSFANTPHTLQTPITTPNISIPQYFQESSLPANENMLIRESISPRKSPISGANFNLERSLPQTANKAATSRFAKGRVSPTKKAPIRTVPQGHEIKFKKKEATKGASSPPSYAILMEKVAALRAKHKKQAVPSARELTHKQHLINCQQRQERRRLLNELLQLRQQQSLGLQPSKTPTPVGERFKAIKSRIIAEARTSLPYPYSPVRTPEVVDLPQIQPLVLQQTPPFPFLENVSIPDIASVSMPFDDLDNYTSEREVENEEDLEFELAEIANEAYEFGENVDVPELGRANDDFSVNKRIQLLKQQLLDSSDKINEHILE